jgi:hypothetical protein
MENILSTTEFQERVDSYVSLFAEAYLGRGDFSVEKRRRLWELIDEDQFATCPPCGKPPKLSEREARRRLENCEVRKLRTPLSVFSPILCEGDIPNVDFMPPYGEEDKSKKSVALPYVMRPLYPCEEHLPETRRTSDAGVDPLAAFLAKIEFEKQRILEENPCLEPCELQKLMEAKEEEMWNAFKYSDGVVVDVNNRKKRLKSRGVLMEKIRWRKGDEVASLYDEDCPDDDPLGGVHPPVDGMATRLGKGCSGMPNDRHLSDIACQKLLKDRFSDTIDVDMAVKLVNSPSVIMEDDQGLLDFSPCSDLGSQRPPRHVKQVQDFDQDNRTEPSFSFRQPVHARRAYHFGPIAGNPLFCRKLVECQRLPSIVDMKQQVKLSHEMGKLYRESCGEADPPPSLLCQFFTKLFCPEGCDCADPGGLPAELTFSPHNPCPKLRPPEPPTPTALEALSKQVAMSKKTYPFTSMKKVRPRRHTVKYSWNRRSQRVQETVLSE